MERRGAAGRPPAGCVLAPGGTTPLKPLATELPPPEGGGLVLTEEALAATPAAVRRELGPATAPPPGMPGERIKWLAAPEEAAAGLAGRPLPNAWDAAAADAARGSAAYPPPARSAVLNALMPATALA